MAAAFYWLLYLGLSAAFVAYHYRHSQSYRPQAWPQLPPPQWPDDAPLLSVLVPAWNAAEDIAPFVTAFHALPYPRKELLLCVGGRDGSLAQAQAQAQPGQVIVLEQQPGEGKQGGLAKCFAASQGEIIYLTDIDCRMDATSLQRVLEPLLQGKEAVVTGSSRPHDAQLRHGAVAVHWALVRKAEGRQGSYVSGILGRNCAVTRAAVEAINGFAFAAPTGTDYRMAQALSEQGYAIWREPTSEIATEYAWPLRSYIRKRGRWVRNILLYAQRPRQNAEFFNALSVALLPLAMLLALLLSALLSLFTPLALAYVPAFVVLLLLAHGTLQRLYYLRETLSDVQAVSACSLSWKLRGAGLNWLAQLAAGLYALTTWLVPSLRKRW